MSEGEKLKPVGCQSLTWWSFSLPFLYPSLFIPFSLFTSSPLATSKLSTPNSLLCSLFSPSQRVICPKCRLGVTRIQDLSHADMKKVRQLALIDMTALCDLLELEVKRHKTGKRKIAGTAETSHEGNTRGNSLYTAFF